MKKNSVSFGVPLTHYFLFILMVALSNASTAQDSGEIDSHNNTAANTVGFFLSGANNSADLPWVLCADEAQSCHISTASLVRFGINDQYIYKVATSVISCDANTFGASVLGVDRACAYVPLNLEADSDGDGVIDANDRFPIDPTETADADNDGVGDNGDAFPNDAAETVDTDTDTDTDADGVGDNGDAFPNDESESADTDGDGVGDNADPEPTNPAVTGLNAAPVALNDVLLISQEGFNHTIDVLANDSDSDGDVLTIVSVTATSGTVTINNDQLVYSPAVGFVGRDTIDYTIEDSESATATAQLNIIINPAYVLANKTSGVAPLSVHFDSGAQEQDFHDRQYEWDFGDVNSGHWVGVNGSVGLSKNVDAGPIARHVYTQAGTYTATLTVRDATGVIDSLSQHQQLVDNLPNIPEYSRVLFQRGDTWLTDFPTSRASHLPSNFYISAYGECVNADARGICENAPVLSNHFLVISLVMS